MTDLGALDEADSTYPDGFELGWSASGDGKTYAYRGTFGSVAGLSAALAAMEGGSDAEDRHDTVLAVSGFEPRMPKGLMVGPVPWVRILPDHSSAYLTVGAETSLTIVSHDGLRRHKVAGIPCTGNGTAPWHAMSPGGAVIGLLAALVAYLEPTAA